MADASTTTAITKTCKFFQRKKECKFGNECQFLHPEKPLNLPGVNLTEVKKLHDVPKLLDPSNQEKNSGLQSCRFFKSKRGCAFGNKCRFLHLDLKVSTESEKIEKVSEPDITDQGEEKVTDQHKESSAQRVVCKFFPKEKGCLRGNMCPFAHVTTSIDKTNRKPLAGKVSRKAGNLSSNKKPHLRKDTLKPFMAVKQITEQPVESFIARPDNQNEVIKNKVKAQIPLLPNEAFIAEDKGMDVSEQPHDECKRLRSIEIQQLKRRFKDNYSEITENSCYKIKVKPTDPDWVSKINPVFHFENRGTLHQKKKTICVKKMGKSEEQLLKDGLNKPILP